jgi:lysylphosphatidylglycerol synthase-like protein
MDEQNNKRFYKVISLFIKSGILIFSLYYIWEKLNDTQLNYAAFPELFSGSNAFVFTLILALMVVNWSIEAFKWKLLIAPLEEIGFRSSVKAVLAGVTISIFTPNRVGEFAGRVFFLEKADKIKASLMSLAGSFLQLTVTIIAGVLAYYILQNSYYDFFQMEQFISTNMLLLFILLLFIVIGGVVFFLVINDQRFPWFKKYVDLFKMYPKKKLDVIFYLSWVRYIVFSIQYYLVLQLFGISAGITIVFSLISLTFLVTSAIPTFALTEITVRAGTAIYFFGTISLNHSAIIASSLFLWIVNLALPALIGAGFVWKMKIFKTE